MKDPKQRTFASSAGVGDLCSSPSVKGPGGKSSATFAAVLEGLAPVSLECSAEKQKLIEKLKTNSLPHAVLNPHRKFALSTSSDQVELTMIDEDRTFNLGKHCPHHGRAFFLHKTKSGWLVECGQEAFCSGDYRACLFSQTEFHPTRDRALRAFRTALKLAS